MRPWDLPEFATGLQAGAVAALVLLLAFALASWRRWTRPVPLLGIGFVAAGAWVVDQTHAIPGAVLVGMAGIAAAGAAVDRPRIPWPLPFVVVAPFGWLVGFHGGIVDETWVRVLVAGAAALGGVLAAHTDRAWRSIALGPLLLALTVAGVYATVPDTEEAVALLGVMAPMTILGWPVRAVHLGRPGAAASMALVAWVAAVDGSGRLPSIIGAVGALGVFACWPIGAALAPRRLRRPSVAVASAALVAVHAALVALSSRGIGLGTRVDRAGLLAGVLGVAGMVACALLPAPPPGDPDLAS